MRIIHELAVTEGILKVVLKHAEMSGAQRVLSISLKIGKLRDLVEDWLQRYFDYISRSTAAEGAKIKIEWAPATCRCEDCENLFHIDIWKTIEILCPHCGGKRVILESGQEFYVMGIEVI